MMKKMKMMIECPNHEGNFDCTPFCRLCEGEQELGLEEFINEAHSIAYEGCHKIYINLDEKQTNQMIGYGYGKDGTHLIKATDSNPYDLLETVRDWYNESCVLKFIQAVQTDYFGEDKFTAIVAQGEVAYV